jgi:AraC-like DNA-binding protein
LERLVFFRPPELPGVEIMHVDGCERLWRVFHERFTLASLVSAKGEWIYRGQVLAQETGDVCLMEPGEVHVSTKLQGPGDFRTLHVLPDVLRSGAEELGMRLSGLHLKAARVSDPTFFLVVMRLHGALARKTLPLEIESRYADALRMYLERCFEVRPRASVAIDVPQASLRRARDLLLDRLTQSVSLEDLSHAASLSRFHLARAFTRRYGLPPHQYQLHARVARARELMLEGMSIAHAAVDLGFTDQSHFTRCFRNVLGVTPGVYLGSSGFQTARTY